MLVGAILAPGKRTVTAALRTMGLSGDRHFQSYHRVLNRQCLDRCIPDKATLAQETAAWAAKRNNNGSTANWRFTTDDARIKLKRLYPSIDA